jgi:hypothetical protein
MIVPQLNKYNSLIFLDLDGVLNCQLFYTEKFSHLERFDGIPLYKVVKKYLHKIVKKKEISDLDYYKSQICSKRIGWLNELCNETNSAVVLSASMRSGHDVEKLQEIFNYCGATFTIIDKTGYCNCRIRGVEIHKWLQDNCMKWFGVHYYDFYRYAIIDDDSDMLLGQQFNFFKVDNYSGLTPTTCYQIKRFFTHKTF